MEAVMHTILLRSSSQNYRLCLLPVGLEYWKFPRLRLPLKAFFVSTVDAWLAWLMVDRAIIMCGLYSQLGGRPLNSAWRCAGVSRWSWAKLALSGNAQPASIMLHYARYLWWSALAVIAQLTPYLFDFHWRRTMISGFHSNITHQEQCRAGDWYELLVSLSTCKHSAQNVCCTWAVWEATLLSLANTDGISRNRILLQQREEAPPSIYDHSEMKSGSSGNTIHHRSYNSVKVKISWAMLGFYALRSLTAINTQWILSARLLSSLYYCCQATAKGLVWIGPSRV